MKKCERNGVRTALYAVTFIEILTAGFMAHMMSTMVLCAAKEERLIKRLRPVLLALLCAHIAIIIGGAFSDLIYYFDGGNVYHRGAGYLISNICPLVMMAINAVL